MHPRLVYGNPGLGAQVLYIQHSTAGAAYAV
jgi:hypothetical protein